MAKAVQRAMKGALAGLAVLFAVYACTASRQQVQSEFWLDAQEDPVVLIEPAALLAEDVTTLVLQGVVIRHQAAYETVAEHSLELLRDDGETILLHYSAGKTRRAPVERGQLIRVRVWQAIEPPTSPLRALTIDVWRPGDEVREQQPALVIQVNGLIPIDLLPEPLRRLVPNDTLVYQAAERLQDRCQRAVAHRGFAIELDDTLLATQEGDTLLAPGMERFMGDGEARMEVLLLDNREVFQTDCTDHRDALWAFSAIAAPQRLPVSTWAPPAALRSLPLPLATTATTAPTPVKPKSRAPRRPATPRPTPN